MAVSEPKTILIVDDNPTNLRLMGDVLTSRGYIYIAETSGQGALDRIKADSPDLVLLDVQMPGLSGTDVARIVRSTPEIAHTRLVAITAMAMRGDKETILAAGFDDYLAKPYKLGELVSTVSRWLG
jgi:two-component system, cell cycle response regulator DivK